MFYFGYACATEGKVAGINDKLFTGYKRLFNNIICHCRTTVLSIQFCLLDNMSVYLYACTCTYAFVSLNKMFCLRKGNDGFAFTSLILVLLLFSVKDLAEAKQFSWSIHTNLPRFKQSPLLKDFRCHEVL